MGLFIKVCAVHTPSSNPKAPPAQHWGDTLRRRRSRPRQQQQQNPGYSEPLQQLVCIVIGCVEDVEEDVHFIIDCCSMLFIPLFHIGYCFIWYSCVRSGG